MGNFVERPEGKFLETEEFGLFRLELVGPAQSRRLSSSGGRDPLYRALGKSWAKSRRENPETRRWVVDASFGFGGDSLRFAAWGATVLGFEESPTVAELWREAAGRAMSDAKFGPLVAQIELREGDAREWLRERRGRGVIQCQRGEFTPETSIVYLDPMFPADGKTAQSKKELKILSLVAKTPSFEREQALFRAALDFGPERVIVKRPIKAKPLSPKLAVAYSGKSHRFDVYTLGISY